MSPNIPSPAITASAARGIFDTMLNNLFMVGLSRLMTVIGVPLLLWAGSELWGKFEGYDKKIATLNETHVRDMEKVSQQLTKQNEILIGLQIRQGVVLQHLSAVESKVFGVPLVNGAAASGLVAPLPVPSIIVPEAASAPAGEPPRERPR